ncbi:MAG: T9SS type A sorting domain-containing protein [Bacteroidetes bacterium]|nr:T9SS type A sorting domain-containing protein [Bacteroidota bacterium]
MVSKQKGNHHFSIGTLPSGVYLVRMSTELQTVTQRLIRLN